jgi:hypothetical protein
LHEAPAVKQLGENERGIAGRLAYDEGVCFIQMHRVQHPAILWRLYRMI